MTVRRDSRLAAVLDTSFWVAAYRAEVAANCLDYFDMVVPQAVEAEILGTPTLTPRREYPYATLFRHFRSQMVGPPEGAPAPLGIFGAGEAEAIAVAGHLGAVLLINERPAGRYAANLGIEILTVPALVVSLCVEDVISDRAARRKLDLIESITSGSIVDQARRALDVLREIA